MLCDRAAMASTMGAWTEPPWESPLDPDACMRAVPPSATMTGMFLEGTAKLARSKGHDPKSARPHYVAFQAYPLREHCKLLVEVAQLVFPDVSLRQGLRRLGRGAPNVLMRSTVGRVVLGAVEGAVPTIQAMAKSYSLHMRPSTLVVEPSGDRAVIIRLSEVHTFLDSHNIGVFEGVLDYAGVRGTIRIQSYTRTTADFLCEW